MLFNGLIGVHIWAALTRLSELSKRIPEWQKIIKLREGDTETLEGDDRRQMWPYFTVYIELHKKKEKNPSENYIAFNQNNL